MQRETKTPAELRDMILQESRRYPKICRDYCFIKFYSQSSEADGCNWRLSTLSGDECEACVVRMEAFLAMLRSKYNLSD